MVWICFARFKLALHIFSIIANICQELPFVCHLHCTLRALRLPYKVSIPPLSLNSSVCVQRIMDCAMANVAGEVAVATTFCTYSNVKLIRKRCLEAKGAVAACKSLHGFRLSENKSRKQARDQVLLCGWLIVARTQDQILDLGKVMSHVMELCWASMHLPLCL